MIVGGRILSREELTQLRLRMLDAARRAARIGAVLDYLETNGGDAGEAIAHSMERAG